MKLSSRLHLWVGVPLALYALIMGATGTILMFRDTIHAWEHPKLYSGPAAERVGDVDAMFAGVKAKYEGWNALSMTWPHEGTPYGTVFVTKGDQSREVFFRMDTGAIVGERNPKASPVFVPERIHNNWFWGRNGRLLNGYGAIGMILLSITGLVLVWPRIRKIGWRTNRDWHYAAGLASCAFILLVSVCAPLFTWRPAYVEVAKWLGQRPVVTLPPGDAKTTLTLGELVWRAEAALPGKPIQRAPMPNPTAPYRVAFREDRFAAFHKVSHVVLDPRDGKVLAVERLEERGAGDSFLAWMVALHFGNYAGRPGEWVYAFLSALLASLGPTGFLIWWRKRR
ncbi:MAG: PepSY-associated TM helix domain-containing protein [Bryobacter sp.]|nr:PepSY-associated TM helix domain-containing protein [Bryobacter sp.]